MLLGVLGIGFGAVRVMTGVQDLIDGDIKSGLFKIVTGILAIILSARSLMGLIRTVKAQIAAEQEKLLADDGDWDYDLDGDRSGDEINETSKNTRTSNSNQSEVKHVDGSGGNNGFPGRPPKPWDDYTQEILNDSIDVSGWNKGSLSSPEESVAFHFYEHGEEVGATDISQYLRKADGFKANLRGAHKSYVEGYVDGVIRYSKNGKYIDLAPDGSIVSFGKQ